MVVMSLCRCVVCSLSNSMYRLKIVIYAKARLALKAVADFMPYPLTHPVIHASGEPASSKERF